MIPKKNNDLNLNVCDVKEDIKKKKKVDNSTKYIGKTTKAIVGCVLILCLASGLSLMMMDECDIASKSGLKTFQSVATEWTRHCKNHKGVGLTQGVLWIAHIASNYPWRFVFFPLHAAVEILINPRMSFLNHCAVAYENYKTNYNSKNKLSENKAKPMAEEKLADAQKAVNKQAKKSQE